MSSGRGLRCADLSCRFGQHSGQPAHTSCPFAVRRREELEEAFEAVGLTLAQFQRKKVSADCCACMSAAAVARPLDPPSSPAADLKTASSSLPPQVVKSFIANGRGKAAAIAGEFKGKRDAREAKSKRRAKIDKRCDGAAAKGRLPAAQEQPDAAAVVAARSRCVPARLTCAPVPSLPPVCSLKEEGLLDNRYNRCVYDWVDGKGALSLNAVVAEVKQRKEIEDGR